MSVKTKLEINDKAPDFVLPDKDSKEHSLKDYKGKWVILYFYPKDNTSGCTLEAKEFTESLEDFRNLEAEIIGVSPDSVKSHTKFVEKHELKITLLSDTEKETLKNYGAWGLKKNYGREYEGVIRSTFIINPEGKVAHHWPKVRVKGHVKAVREKLLELQGKGDEAK